MPFATCANFIISMGFMPIEENKTPKNRIKIHTNRNRFDFNPPFQPKHPFAT